MERGEAVLVQVGDRLTRLRIARGLDPAAAARAAGIDEERLAAAEDGTASLTAAELDGLAAAYGIDAAEIFGGQTTPVQNLVGG
jgi:transcriptional regulator with XRE-family HTH domain